MAAAQDQLEGGKKVAAIAPGAGIERHRVLDGAQADQCGLDLRRLGKQLQRGRGDDAERAFRADEDLLEVVAAIVLAQHLQPVPDAAVGQHHFEPEHKVARHAVAQHVEAAGIGGDVAADAAASLRAEGDRQQAVVLFRRALGVLEDAAGLDHHGEVDRADRADPVHALQ
ncbi:hypothetical protein ACVILI_002317 [Mesorhizobium sp. USDA 4775]